MNTQPEALRLADLLTGDAYWSPMLGKQAAAELRRLHEENERNKTTIKEWLQANAPGGWIDELRVLNQELLWTLKEVTADYADRFDLDDPSTNPGIKSCVKLARAAISKATGETK